MKRVLRGLAFAILCAAAWALLTACAAPAPAAQPEPATAPEPTTAPVTVTLPDGSTVDSGVTTVDLTAVTDDSAAAYADCLKKLPGLVLLELGAQREALSWDSVVLITGSCPQVGVNYSFTYCGKEFRLADTRMDLNHCPIDDGGELLLKIVACMPNLRWLDMDSCGVPDGDMERIRDALPNAQVVWRIWFGDTYSVRTDTERILASRPSSGGVISDGDGRTLGYCTKVKYLDLGNNGQLKDISFVKSMPELEVLIMANTGLRDLSPLTDCPELEYLEIQDSDVSDLSPLSSMEKLRHLNICNCGGISDISPLFGLTGLERLWIGNGIGVPTEQAEQMRAAVPGCLVDTSASNAIEGMWRSAVKGEMYPLHPRYVLLREQFGGYTDEAYSFWWNDPKY